MKKLIIIAMVSLTMSGCVSRVFSIGHENFACNGDTAGGKCIDTDTVYKQKEAIAAGYDDQNKSSSADVKPAGQASGAAGTSSAYQYVYSPPKILKVKVAKYRSDNGDMVGNTTIFIKADEGYWLDNEGTQVSE